MNREAGSVLIVSLIFLLLLTIVGVGAMRSTILGERMAGNFRDHDMAFQAAEAVLLEAEEWVENWGQTPGNASMLYTAGNPCTGNDCFNSSCSNGLCFSGSFDSSSSTPVTACEPGAEREWQNWDVWEDAGRHRVADNTLLGTVGDSRYIVEFRCYRPRDITNDNPDVNNVAEWSYAFRITAMARGATPASLVMLQSHYKLAQ